MGMYGPDEPDYEASANAQSRVTSAQTAEQYQMDLFTALITGGKIPLFDITDPAARKAAFDLIKSDPEGHDLANPFPGYLEDGGKAAIADIVAAVGKVPDFNERFEVAAKEARVWGAIVQSGSDTLRSLYDGTLEGKMDENLQALKTHNEGLKALDLQEAADIKAKQEGTLAAGENLATSAGAVGEGTEALLDAGLSTKLENADNILATTKSGTSDNTVQQLRGIGSVADAEVDALDANTDVAISGLGEIANTAKQGLAEIKSTEQSGIGQIFDANISSAEGVRDASITGAQDMETAQLNEAGLMGNQMRRTAMVGRRAAEDAYNDSLRGMRGSGIGQGTGSNMRSAFAQNRANQAQSMFAPMAEADSIQLGMESESRLGRVGAENQAKVDFSGAQGLSNVNKASNIAGSNNNFTSQNAGINNDNTGGIAQINLGDSNQRGQIGVGETKQTASVLNAGTIADSGANLNKAVTVAGAKDGFIDKSIANNTARDQSQVRANEIRLNNALMNAGYSDPEIQAMKASLGYDLGEAGQSYSNYNELVNSQLGNIGMTTNLAGVSKYLASAPTDIALGGMDSIARYMSPYTQRTMAPAHQSYINTSPYIPNGGGQSSFDKFLNFSNQFQQYRGDR